MHLSPRLLYEKGNEDIECLHCYRLTMEIKYITKCRKVSLYTTVTLCIMNSLKVYLVTVLPLPEYSNLWLANANTSCQQLHTRSKILKIAPATVHKYIYLSVC